MSTTPDRAASENSGPRTSWLERVRRRFVADRPEGALGRTVSASRAIELVHDGAALLDVRTPSEWRVGHAPHAIHVPIAEIEKASRRLKAGSTVVVVCATGVRSRTAAAHLRRLGFTATSLSGGIRAWHSAGGPIRR